MSVTFNGTKIDTSVSWGTRIVRTADEEHPDSVGFNLNNGNAAAFLRLLEIDNRELIGSCPIDVMVRAVQRARDSFDYRVDDVTRKPEERIGAKGCRMFTAGVDEDYFRRQLSRFADLLADWIELGADGVSWG